MVGFHPSNECNHTEISSNKATNWRVTRTGSIPLSGMLWQLASIFDGQFLLDVPTNSFSYFEIKKYAFKQKVSKQRQKCVIDNEVTENHWVVWNRLFRGPPIFLMLNYFSTILFPRVQSAHLIQSHKLRNSIQRYRHKIRLNEISPLSLNIYTETTA